MSNRITITALAFLASAALTSAAPAQIAPSPQYDQLGAYRAQGENPYYHVNRYGYGNYVQGPDGAYGGYPAGSPGAIMLQNRHDRKCRYAPETC